MRVRGAWLATLVLFTACKSGVGVADPTDVPFDVEPLALPLPDGGTAPAGSRFAIDLAIGDAPPIRGFLDTGSSGLVVAPNAPPETLAALASTTGDTFSTTYGSGVTATGVVAMARVTIGGRVTESPIGVALVQELVGGIGGAALQQLFNGYSVIVGIGMRNASSALGNPLVQLPGHPAYVVAAPDFGGGAGKLTIGPSESERARYRTLQLTTAPRTSPSLVDGTLAWTDNAIPACVADATTGEQLCAPTILDTGDPGVYLYWPAYSGPALLPAGSLIEVSIGAAAAPVGTFAVTVGAGPQPGLDAVTVVTSGSSHISVGTMLFHRFDVFFDQVRGQIGLASHGSGTTTTDAAVLPCDVKYDCRAGETCGTMDGTNWSCAPDGQGQVGSSCDPSTAAGITCGDRMACVGNGGNPPVGTCLYWCDPSDACPAGAGTCTTIHTTAGATLSFCR